MDSLQLMMQQAANSASPFADNSRYRHTEVIAGALPDGRTVTYLRRRFLPQPEQMATLAQYVVKPDDRLDNLADQFLGDPELFWQICDANRALRPDDLTDDPADPTILRVIRIGLPVGVPSQTQL